MYLYTYGFFMAIFYIISVIYMQAISLTIVPLYFRPLQEIANFPT